MSPPRRAGLRDAGIAGAAWLASAVASGALAGPFPAGRALWLPAGVALALLLPSAGWRARSVAIGLAAFGLEVSRGTRPLAALAAALAESGVPAVAALALRYWFGRCSAESRVFPLLLVSLPVTALAAGLTATRSGETSSVRFATVWAGCLLGTVLAVAALSVRPPSFRIPPWPRLVEAGVLLTGTVVRRSEGSEPAAVFGIVQDVTEKHSLELALSQSEERYLSLFEESSVVMLLLDPESGRILEANSAACAFYGRSREQMSEIRVFAVNALPAEEVAGLLSEAVAGRQASYECVHRAAHGELRDVVEHCSPVRVGDRTLLLSVVRDVTDVRRAQEAVEREMREASARLRSVIDATPLGVVMLDEDLRIGLANPAATRLLGGAEGRLEGLGVERVLSRGEAHAIVGRALHGEAVAGAEIEHARADGTPLALRVFSAPLRGPEKQIRGVVAVFEDATERRLVEETLRLAQKLEVLATVTGGVAHDFNNLLTVIVGHLDRALCRLPAESPARHQLERALPAAQRAVSLAWKMLAYAGGTRPLVAPLDLASLVREDRSMLEASVPGHVILQLELPDRSPVIEASTEEIRQALHALLVNAVEAIGGRRGKITVTVSRKLVSSAHGSLSQHTGRALVPGEYASLQIEDDGAGILPKNLSRVFDPFFTTKFVGRGLGLAAVLGIVRSHRGGIGVESTPGSGTRFEIVFPAIGLNALGSPPAASGSRDVQ